MRQGTVLTVPLKRRGEEGLQPLRAVVVSNAHGYRISETQLAYEHERNANYEQPQH